MSEQRTMRPAESAASDNYQREADSLASLLEHPGLPEDYADYIENLVLELANHTSLFTPAVLRAAWPLIRREPGNEGKGVWDALKMALRAFADEEADAAMDAVSKGLYEAKCQLPPASGEWPDVIGDNRKVN